VEVAERYVDGQGSQDEVAHAWERFNEAAESGALQGYPGLDAPEAIRSLVCYVDPASSLQLADEVAAGVGAVAAQSIPLGPPATWSDARTAAYRNAERGERAIQVTLLRDIFNNPFRPIGVNPACVTQAVLELTRTIYHDRAFDRLRILAHALEEAGCDNADILSHCRGPGEHVRGCWVVDLLTGRE
jgi:hypothetical protein